MRPDADHPAATPLLGGAGELPRAVVGLHEIDDLDAIGPASR
jgi:hypothetical protein